MPTLNENLLKAGPGISNTWGEKKNIKLYLKGTTHKTFFLFVKGNDSNGLPVGQNKLRCAGRGHAKPTCAVAYLFCCVSTHTHTIAHTTSQFYVFSPVTPVGRMLKFTC